MRTRRRSRRCRWRSSGSWSPWGRADRPVAFACIGTDRSTGDALGPLVGQRLLKLGFDPDGGHRDARGAAPRPQPRASACGRCGRTRRAPSWWRSTRPSGRRRASASVNLRRGGLLPGQGVGKALPAVGELSLTATVNVQAGALDVQILQSTRLYLVQELAEMIGVACWWAHRNVRRAVVAPAEALAV